MSRAYIHSIFFFLLQSAVVFSMLFLILGNSAHAQQFIEINTSPTLSLSPTDPSPQDTVTVSLDAYALDMNGASIVWYIDGVENQEFRNARSIQVSTGTFGLKKTVSAVVSLRDGTSVSAKRTISPSSVDLIIEPDSLTPPFYRGRALPVGGEPLRAVAIPHINEYPDREALTYTWALGTQVLFGGPQKGIAEVTITMPKRETTLSVVVTNGTGNRLGGKTVVLTPAQPELLFYEANPLRGMSQKALGETHTLIGDEITVYASIYNISRQIFALDPVFSWSIDGNQTQSAGNDPRTITLRSSGGSGNALVGFELINRQVFTQFVSGNFTLMFDN